jgi:D-sedoheptulose 7-phosphate isomerase
MALSKYLKELNNNLGRIEVYDSAGKKIEVDAAAERVIKLIGRCREDGKKAILIGNGGSAAIASHQAVDFWKNAGVRAIAFNDPSLLTCVSNDYGYEHVFENPIGMFADKGDILFAISSSGKSKNILRGVEAARKKGCAVITLSGFQSGNPLRKMGDLNFYVPVDAYGHVEIIHGAILHYIYEMVMEMDK